MVRSVVTGAAGFLGSHLVDRLLSDDHEVVGVDNLSTGSIANLRTAKTRRRFRFLRSDLVDLGRLPAAERYWHLASPASPLAYQRHPIATLRVNAEGTHRVLETARRHDAAVFLASTSEVYGDPEVHPQPERYWGHVNPTGLRSCYDEGKRYAEALALAYHRLYGLDVRIGRIFNTYGPRMDPTDGRVISNFVVQALRGEPFTIHGSGAQTRSYCYVSDLIEAIVRLGRAPASVPSPMNLGTPEEFTVTETARAIARILGVRFRTRKIPAAPDDPVRRCPDISLARTHLRWAPSVTFDDGVRRTAEFFRPSPTLLPRASRHHPSAR